MLGRKDFSGLVATLSCACVVIFSAALSGAADPASEAQIAQADFSAAAISWTPLMDFETAVLTVSGPGDVIVRREFAAGEAIRLDAFDKSIGALEDGQYAWEIRFSPVLDPAVKRALVAARESGDSTDLEALKQKGLVPTEPLVTSGYFRIMDGWIVVDGTEAPMRRVGGRVEASGSGATVDSDSGGFTKDVVYADDLIVTGSACVGFDCVNGESFGFDTIRLKENNLRIRAYDTSSSAGFPSRDWQITFNDSANGGANKFSIDDIDGGRTPFTIEAGAPTNSLFVDDRGYVGFRTSTPVVELHVVDGDTPTLRLEQNGSSGFTPQTWDVAGNETNFFVRDVTNGSKLPFRIRPNAPSNSLYINTDGNVGLGTASPDAELDIEADGPIIRYTNIGTGGGGWEVYINEITGRFNFRDITTQNIPFKIEPGANTNLMMLGRNAADRVDINGFLFINGVNNSTPDYVFSADFGLESIEDHARYMWENKHLPAVGPAAVDQEGLAVIDVANRSQGVLEELEIAHIYIEQLHESIKALELRIIELEASSD